MRVVLRIMMLIFHASAVGLSVSLAHKQSSPLSLLCYALALYHGMYALSNIMDLTRE